MSYDLRIYTVRRPDYSELTSRNPKAQLNSSSVVFSRKDYQIVFVFDTPVEDEDIPQEIAKQLPGLRYLVECSVEPITSDPKILAELWKSARFLAKDAIGVIFDPQRDEIVLPSGVKRVLKVEKTKRFTVLEMSWWFNHQSVLNRENLIGLLEVLERYLPESLPRRYGEYEPPTETFSDKGTFADFLIENADMSVWYPAKPVDYVHFGVPELVGPTRMGYRFGRFSVSVNAEVLNMPGWKTTLRRLFEKTAIELDAFYADIYLLRNHIWSRTVSYSDRSTEQHPIVSWWWNGIPRTLGAGLIVGKPISELVEIKRPTSILPNGSVLLVSEKFDSLRSREVKVDRNILQPKIKDRDRNHGFSGVYPKIWPFRGPKAE